jgi:hypothetical protein
MQRDTYGVPVEEILHAAMPLLLGMYDDIRIFCADTFIEYIDRKMESMLLHGQAGQQDHTGDVGSPWSTSESSPLYPATPPRSQGPPRSRYGCSVHWRHPSNR